MVHYHRACCSVIHWCNETHCRIISAWTFLPVEQRHGTFLVFAQLMLLATTRGQPCSFIWRAVAVRDCFHAFSQKNMLFTTKPKRPILTAKVISFNQLCILAVSLRLPPHPLSAVIAAVASMTAHPIRLSLAVYPPLNVSRAHEAKCCSLSFRWLIGIMWTDTSSSESTHNSRLDEECGAAAECREPQ